MRTRKTYTQTILSGGAFTGVRTTTIRHDEQVVPPVSYDGRRAAYHAQNGGGAARLTQRQVRQLNRMERRAVGRVAV